MKSLMVHDFSRVPKIGIEVSTFDRSHGVKTAFDAGKLIPIYVDEVVPGDTFHVKANMLCKMLNPMVSAPMDNMFLDTQWFYVPSRLLWTNFTKMMGERVNPADSIDYTVPQVVWPNGCMVGGVGDYMGIPPNVPWTSVNALPLRAYVKIWDDWYRAGQIQDSVIQSSADLGDGQDPDHPISYDLLRARGKRFDYFTSCLPSPQLGAGLELPIGDTAPVYGTGDTLTITGKGSGGNYLSYGLTTDTFKAVSGSSTVDHPGLVMVSRSGGKTIGSNAGSIVGFDDTLVGIPPKGIGQSSGMYADLTSATAVTINSLRNAFQLQRLLEKDARGTGSRYVEIIRAHFNCICPDARLQRSEYLGGSSQLINISQVIQTSATGDGTPLGERAGIAGCFSNVDWTKSFTEHGYIIGLASVRCDLSYQQGLNRMWSRKRRYDFYWPVLAHLGEQAVLNKEIYLTNDTEQNNAVFGYQERYAEYRYHPSLITGKLRSGVEGSLDVWHLAQRFMSLPTLNTTFIEERPPLARVLSVANEPQFIFDAYIDCKCTRPMPLYGVPGLVDHF